MSEQPDTLDFKVTMGYDPESERLTFRLHPSNHEDWEIHVSYKHGMERDHFFEIEELIPEIPRAIAETMRLAAGEVPDSQMGFGPLTLVDSYLEDKA